MQYQDDTQRERRIALWMAIRTRLVVAGWYDARIAKLHYAIVLWAGKKYSKESKWNLNMFYESRTLVRLLVFWNIPCLTCMAFAHFEGGNILCQPNIGRYAHLAGQRSGKTAAIALPSVCSLHCYSGFTSLTHANHQACRFG